MASPQDLSFRRLLLLYLVSLLFSSFLVSAVSEVQPQKKQFVGRRMLEIEEEGLQDLPKKKSTKLIEKEEENQPKKKLTKTQAKLIEMEGGDEPKKKSTKTQTKLIETDEEEQPKKKTSKSQAKLIEMKEEELPKKKSTKTQTKLAEEDAEEQPKKKSTKNPTKLVEGDEEENPKKKSTKSTGEEDQPKKKSTKATEEEDLLKKKVSLSTKNQTKLIKPTTNSTKVTTKLVKPTTNSTKKATTSSGSGTILPKTQLKKLNSTSKSSNSTKSNPTSIKKSPDLLEPSTPKNKTATVTKPSQKTTAKKSIELKSKTSDKSQLAEQNAKQEKTRKPNHPNWMDQDDEDDLVAEFRDLPSKFHQTFIPDLERISTTSKVYLNKANKEITEGFKPLVGSKYAPTIASIISCIFILAPLLLVTLIFNRIKAYFSLQQILLFIQIYLSIYFSILAFSSLVTGLEPLKFFYSTSQSSYVWLQVLQTLGYVIYLLLLLMYLVVVFSTETGLGSKLLGLGQTIVGFTVGLHYYARVFHRAVLHQPPKTNWKVHGIYATCFFLICLCTRAERRKKAYLQDSGEEGKKS
ncbi:PREDICTED: arginine/serine-rich protein PNISR-like [Nelumbo nucifera]|uniref:Arginine/serine-rich protein PNISR-like n=1 Tax=Nelumbo nucifera TaxID=4432 RepID=A0A1U8B110_NELNU|nr:PREDICTED: arginine/serine-rich protein PNISR-like [Nelumbo nucifera]